MQYHTSKVSWDTTVFPNAVFLKLTYQHIRVYPQDYDTAVPVLSAWPVQNQQLL